MESHVFELIFENVDAPLAYLDQNFNLLCMNSAYAAAAGTSANCLPGRNHFDCYPDTEKQALFGKVLETEQPCDVHAKAPDHADDRELRTTQWDWNLRPVGDIELF